MSGMSDTVMVILVPGGPDVGEIEIPGLGIALRSDAAHAVPKIGRRIIITPRYSEFNFA